MDKKILLLVAAAVCVGIYFYGTQVDKENKFLKALPVIGGGAYALNFVINLATQ